MLAVYLAAHARNGLNRGIRSLLHALSQNNGVCSRRQVLHTLMDHRLGQNRRRGSSVSGHVVGLRCHFLYKLCAHILKGILQLDLLRNGNTVVGNQGSAVLLVKHYVSSLGSKGHSYSICQLVYTGLQCSSSLYAILNFLCHF